MLMPDYKGGSIVNLMSSIVNAYGGKHPYPELKILKSSELKKTKNLIFFIMDGLGYESLMGYKDSFLHKHLKGKITSVFPPTTAACVTVFGTGLPPQQTAITSWYMQMKELGMIFKPLMFMPKVGEHIPLGKYGIDSKELFKLKNIFEMIDDDNIEGYNIIPRILLMSEYNNALSNKCTLVGYRSQTGFLKQITKVLKGKKRKLIYAYSPLFDSACHEFGTKSLEAKKIAEEFDSFIKQLINKLKDKDTTLIITADHGLIDTPPDRNINLADHPELNDCLSMPFSGEPRATFCYIRPSKVENFKKYYKKHLSHAFDLIEGREMIDKHYFGLYKEHPKLYDRIGDYVLLAKENYVIKDFLHGQEENYHIGNHGGLSKEELYVPLIVIQP